MKNKQKPLPANTDEVYLSSRVTVAKYRDMENRKASQEIAEFVRQRFLERYLLPVKRDPRDSYAPAEGKSGFAMMAIGCLMIEALESFYQGWSNTWNKKGEDIFNSFFARYQEFAPLQGLGGPFYAHIRCGILHQAETTGGWLIRWNYPIMVDINNKIIGAYIFLKSLDTCLNHYCDELLNKDWDDSTLLNFRKKMNAVIQNSRR